MKRSLVAVLIVVAVALAGFFYLRHGYVYEISQGDIQSRIEPHFPVEKCVLVFCLELDNPFVKLSDGRTRIEFGSDALMEVAFSNEQYDGSAGFSGELRYISEESAFFLQDSKLEQLEVNGVSEEHKRDLDQLAAMLVSEYLRANPIYSFRGTALELFAPWLELKEVNVRDEILSIRLGLVD
ncbi:MAG: DUF1439 domain-containing protein [Gammaproteobacteria bacterium]|nr:DUF1439 domain-containing protein [Gammaproteobacteria bacterium]